MLTALRTHQDVPRALSAYDAAAAEHRGASSEVADGGTAATGGPRIRAELVVGYGYLKPVTGWMPALVRQVVRSRPMPVRDLPRSRVPALVNGLGYAVDPIGHIRRFAGRYGTISSPRFPGMGLIVSLADPELVRQVFTGDAAIFHAGEASRPVLEPTLGATSVLTLDEEPHMRQRKLLLAPFHGANVRRWEATIRAVAESGLASWPVGRPFALHDHTRAITLEVILRAVFGVREAARFERGRALVAEFANRAHPISMFPVTRRDLGPLSPWVRFKRARAALDAFLYEEIAQRRAAPDLAERDDVLSLLLCATRRGRTSRSAGRSSATSW